MLTSKQLLLVSVTLFVIWYFNLAGTAVYSSTKIVTTRTVIENNRPNLFLTYTSKADVPQKVWDGLQKYASDYNVRFFDDAACVRYLTDHFDPKIIERYNAITQGAHRADLWRYCVLYREGGVYIDIKTVLTRPLSSFIPSDHNSSVLSSIPKTVYQGILSVPRPGDKVMSTCISHILNTPQRHLDSTFLAFLSRQSYGYLMITGALYEAISESTGISKLKHGRNGNWTLFQEFCDDSNCTGGIKKDRNGNCCTILAENGELVARTRYSDFPWVKQSRPQRR